jgi:hypothetical protein
MLKNMVFKANQYNALIYIYMNAYAYAYLDSPVKIKSFWN